MRKIKGNHLRIVGKYLTEFLSDNKQLDFTYVKALRLGSPQVQNVCLSCIREAIYKSKRIRLFRFQNANPKNRLYNSFMQI